MPTFTPPSHDMRYPTGPLWSRVSYPKGMTLLKIGSFYTLLEYPDDEAIAAADIAYLGGHDYTISAEEADALTAAGYGAFIQGL